MHSVGPFNYPTQWCPRCGTIVIPHGSPEFPYLVRRCRDLENKLPALLLLECGTLDIPFFFKQSAAHRTEMGIELDGVVVRQYPKVALPLV